MSADQAAKTDEALRTQRQEVLAGLTGDARKQVAKAFAKAPQLWIEAFGHLGAKADDAEKLKTITKALRSTLPDVPSGLAAKVTEAVKDAQKTAVSHSLAVIPAKVDPPKVTVPAESKKAITDLVKKSARAMKLADLSLGQVKEGDTFSAVTSALTNASVSLNSIDSGASWAMQTGFSDAATDVAQAAGVGWVIVPERDACLDCNAYAGQTDKDTDDTPPFHPHCLCALQPYSQSWATPGETTFPEALQREATRSVLRGESAYDSNAARVRAADQLLKAGNFTAPASVKTNARRAVRKGGF